MSRYNRTLKNKMEKSQHVRWELALGSKVWVYLRHSPGDKQTIDSQVLEMQKWCAENSWIIERMFIDEGIEGSKEDRPQFQEMIALSRQEPRRVDGIVLWMFSRFARNQLDAQFYKADLRKHGFVVISKSDDIPNNEMAPLMEAFIDWKNQRFLEDLSADVRRGLRYVVEQGYWLGGSPAIGYRLEKVEIGRHKNGSVRYGNRLVKDIALADRVALAWQMKLQNNASFPTINAATHLYADWHHLGDFFRNMVYAGICEFADKRYPLDWEGGARFCDSYITLDEYYQVQSNLETRRIGNVAPRTLSSSYLLSGLLRCKVCTDSGVKSNLQGGQQNQGRYRAYCCGRKHYGKGLCSLPQYEVSRIERPILKYFKEVVFTPEYLQQELAQANELLNDSHSSSESQMEQANQAAKDFRRKMDNIISLIADKGITPLLSSQYDSVHQKWQEATQRLASLKTQVVIAQRNALTMEDLEQFIDLLIERMEQGDIELQRQIINTFVERIDVSPGSLDLILRFRPDGIPSDREGRFSEKNRGRFIGAFSSVYGALPF